MMLKSTHLLHEPMLNVDENLSRLSVTLDQHVKSITILDPSKQTCTRRKRSDGVRLNAQVSLGSFLIGRQQRVDKTKELHDSFVLSQIFVSWSLVQSQMSSKLHTLQTISVLLSIRSLQTELSGTLFRGDDVESRENHLNTNDGFSTLIGTWNGNDEIPYVHQSRRNIL